MSDDTNRPCKRPRTEDVPSQSSAVTTTATEANTTLDSVRRHEEFWFNDGSVILVAGNTGFRVYRALLEAQSTVFTDMLSSPCPNTTFKGCPIVHLLDAPEDLVHFLRILIPKSRRMLFSREFAFSFPQISAIIRLAHKYHVDDVLDQAIASLKEYFTSSFDKWESRTGQATINVRPQQTISVINLARLVDCPSLLPVAFYKCAHLGSAVLNGYGREDKSIEHLPRKDTKRCIDGQMKLVEAALAVLVEVFVTRPSDGCASPTRCRTVLQRMLEDAINHEGALSPSVLQSWKEVIVDWAWERGMCGSCKRAMIERDVRVRRKVWDSLPNIFDIKVDGWNGSSGNKTEAVLAPSPR